jgi:hypothetical protein
MANVLTNLAADIYKAADIVGREAVGLIPSVTVNADGSEGAALNDTVRSHSTRAVATASFTPAMTIPEGTDQTVDNKTLTISNQKGVPIPYTGEDVKHLNNGSGFESVYGDQIMQAMRAITNDIESDIAVEAYKNASRSVGTSGTTPFASNFNTIAEVRQILLDNACPVNDGRLSLVINSAAGTKLRNLAQLQKANESASDRLLRQGELLNLQGMMMKESLQIQTHTAGTGASYLLNDASSAIGNTTIAVDTGSGTVLAGDVVSFAGDTNDYVVSAALAGGAFTIQEPGLKVALADNAAVTLKAAYAGNVAFHQSAIELAIRAPASPLGGDAATDVMMVQDPHSGLVFEVSHYKGFKKAMIHVAAVWGVKAWKPEFIASLRG